ncbi:hypothetical protein B0H63DRAFT_529886 [Podospora didyma]|uniref:Clr5 domain-containing protein n=1 Tax=Podospora didyma TaxID=330526 RepID=A0AAE0JY42_9PEZI|nr:hypothetical protein B0H63DRAFT_529886 [Podospora didyma]
MVRSTGSRRAPSPSQEAWDEYQPIITRLYMEDNMTLDRVAETMQREFCFNETLNQHAPEEGFFRAVLDYLDASSATTVWNEGKHSLSMSKAARDGGRFRAGQFHDMMVAAINLWDMNDKFGQAETVSIIRGCMEAVGDILVDQDPFLLANLLNIFRHIRRREVPKLGKFILGHVAELSPYVLGESHPLNNIWKQLAQCPTENETGCHDATLLVRGIGVVLDRFQTRLGPDHASSLILRLYTVDSLDEDAQSEENKILNSLIASVVSASDLAIVQDTSAYQLRFCVARNIRRSRAEVARKLIDQVERDERHRAVVQANPSLRYEYLTLLGHIQSAEGRKEDAIHQFQSALEVARSAWGFGGPFAGAALAQIETLHRVWGDVEEAGRIRKLRMERLGLVCDG